MKPRTPARPKDTILDRSPFRDAPSPGFATPGSVALRACLRLQGISREAEPADTEPADLEPPPFPIGDLMPFAAEFE